MAAAHFRLHRRGRGWGAPHFPLQRRGQWALAVAQFPLRRRGPQVPPGQRVPGTLKKSSRINPGFLQGRGEWKQAPAPSGHTKRRPRQSRHPRRSVSGCPGAATIPIPQLLDTTGRPTYRSMQPRAKPCFRIFWNGAGSNPSVSSLVPESAGNSGPSILSESAWALHRSPRTASPFSSDRRHDRTRPRSQSLISGRPPSK